MIFKCTAVMAVSALISLFFACSNADSPQQKERLDASFNPPFGFTLFSLQTGAASRGVETALQSDGKIIVMGSANNGVDDDILLLRYTAAGQLDTRFGTNGSVRYGGSGNERGLGLAIIPSDNSIIVTGFSTVAGSRDLLVVKYSADGKFLKHLLYAGIGTDIGFGVTISADQKIVVVGESSPSLSSKQDLLLLRMDVDLQLDPTFGQQGVVHYNGPKKENDKGFGVVVQPDGKVIACGAVIINGKEDMLVARFNPDGSIDNSFGTKGSFIWSSPLDESDYANGLALQPDGRIVVTGAASTTAKAYMTTLRLLPNGTLDSTFGQYGVAIYAGLSGSYAYPYGVIIQSDGKVMVAGTSEDSAANRHAIVIRYTPDGFPDYSFGFDGLFVFGGLSMKEYAANGLVLQPDQAIVVTGYSNNGMYDSVLTFRLK